MKVYIELNSEGTNDPKELEVAKQVAQRLANFTGVTVQFNNGNYGSYILEPTWMGNYGSYIIEPIVGHST